MRQYQDKIDSGDIRRRTPEERAADPRTAAQIIDSLKVKSPGAPDVPLRFDGAPVPDPTASPPQPPSQDQINRETVAPSESEPFEFTPRRHPAAQQAFDEAPVPAPASRGTGADPNAWQQTNDIPEIGAAHTSGQETVAPGGAISLAQSEAKKKTGEIPTPMELLLGGSLQAALKSTEAWEEYKKVEKTFGKFDQNKNQWMDGYEVARMFWRGDIAKMNSGGSVPGVGNTDTVPAVLTPGEFVVNSGAASRNMGLLQNINNGSNVAKYNRGGIVYAHDGGVVEDGPSGGGGSSFSDQFNQNIKSLKETFQMLISTFADTKSAEVKVPPGFDALSSALDNFVTGSDKLTTSLNTFTSTFGGGLPIFLDPKGLSKIEIDVSSLKGLEDFVRQDVIDEILRKIEDAGGRRPA